jgi:hypothetical protein
MMLWSLADVVRTGEMLLYLVGQSFGKPLGS